MTEYPKRVTDVNKALKAAGYPEYKLFKDKGAYYFYGGNTTGKKQELWFILSEN